MRLSALSTGDHAGAVPRAEPSIFRNKKQRRGKIPAAGVIVSEINKQGAAAAFVKVLVLIIIALSLAGYGLFRGQLETALAGGAILLENLVPQLVLIVFQVVAHRIVPLEERLGIYEISHITPLSPLSGRRY